MSLRGYKKKYGPAPWTMAFPGDVAKLTPQKLAVLVRQPARRKFIRRESRQHARGRAEYNARVEEWLLLPANQWCRVAQLLGWKPRRATQCHHIRGRLGPLLMCERFWCPVSADGHAWIDANRDEARRLGLLAQRGDWHRTDDI